jgi:hypothetical protein
MLIAKQHETNLSQCGIIAVLSTQRSQALAASSPSYLYIGIIATYLRSQALAEYLPSYDMTVVHLRSQALVAHSPSYLYSGIIATPTLLWNHAACKAVLEHTRSLRHHCCLINYCGVLITNFHLRSQALATLLSSLSCCFLESSVRPLQGCSCSFIANFHSPSQALATSL